MDLTPNPVAIRRRRIIGVVIAIAAVCIGLPAWLTPIAGWVTAIGISGLTPDVWLAVARKWLQDATWMRLWPVLPALISLLLLLAVWLIPPASKPRRRIAPVVRDETAMAVGALLLCEPLMHIGFLWWSGSHPTAVSRDAVFPIPMLGGLATVPWWAGIATILTVSVLVPVAEECFFRGRLLDLLRYWFDGHRFATVWAVSLTTLAFAAAHGSEVQALFALPLGLLLALIRLRSGGIGGCILAHACHNSMFLFLGPMLFAKPWVAPLLALSGVMLIAAAWTDHPATSNRPRVPNRWRPFVAVFAVIIAVVVIRFTASTYHYVQDRLWAAAAHTLITKWYVDNDVLINRIHYQSYRGRLNNERRNTLYDLLVENPCPSFEDGNPRQTQVLAQLDPERFAAEVTDEAIFDSLYDLSTCRATWKNIAIAARILAARSPQELTAVALSEPTCLVQWFDISQNYDLCVGQLLISEGPVRKRLLAACERAFPGRVPDILFALPIDKITPIDRRHLFYNYPNDARERLRILSETDPAKALAFYPE